MVLYVNNNISNENINISINIIIKTVISLDKIILYNKQIYISVDWIGHRHNIIYDLKLLFEIKKKNQYLLNYELRCV